MDTERYDSSTEVDGWDALALSAEFDRYLSLLEGRFDDTPISGPLTPLQEAMLVNAATTGQVLSKLATRSPSASENRILSLVARDAHTNGGREHDENSETDTPESRDETEGVTPPYAWEEARNLLTASLGPTFLIRISTLAQQVGEVIHRFEPHREWIGSLLFQPLQNAIVHGLRPEEHQSLSGLAVRRTGRIEPILGSTSEYERYLAQISSGGHDGFIEFTIHDNGKGIASHFYDAKRHVNDPQLAELPIFNEWVLLNQAFERHQTSRPRDFVRQTTDPQARPGVGLAGLLAAVQRLNAYIEVRSNRLRAYRWYRLDEQVPRDVMLFPRTLHRPATQLCGTIIRIFVPIFLGGNPS